jgi:hypothetical protein
LQSYVCNVLDQLREVADPRTLRAVAHPFRLTLLDLVERHGTLTSAQASDLTGESTASCSFHLRQLAKYGYLEPAPGRNARERPWRRAATGERVPASGDRAVNTAATEAARVFVDRLARDAHEWLDRYADLSGRWRDAALFDDELLYLTPAEVRTLGRAVTDLLAPYRDRTREPSSRPRTSRAVRAAALLFQLP